MARAESGVIGLVLALAIMVGTKAEAGPGPDLEVLMVGKAYSGQAYGTPDSSGRTGSVFEGLSFKVKISEPLDCDQVDIVSRDSRIGEMHVLGGGETGLLTFKKAIPDTAFHLYKRPAVGQPETYEIADLPVWPARKWLWKPEPRIEDAKSKWKAENYIGTYVVEQANAETARTLYSISQVKGDDEE